MEIVHTIVDVRSRIQQFRSAGQRVAFIPTMGALHEGHLALIDEGRRHADILVASIFVNPLQFGANEDFDKYPRTFDMDAAALRTRGVHILFAPSATEIFPTPQTVQVSANIGENTFEGAARPGHFTGVLTIVAKLFNIVQPDVAIFGQKDLQQLSLVRHMVRELNIPVEIVALPTVREEDGLAMSSRNRYLAPPDRQRATRIFTALRAIQALFAHGEHDTSALLSRGQAVLAEDPNIRTDYLAIVDPHSFAPVSVAQPSHAVIVAARVGSTRLLDNAIL